MSGDLAALAVRMGIAPRYQDLRGDVRDTAPATQRALLAAMGMPVGSAADAQEHLQAATMAQQPWRVVVAGSVPAHEPAGPWVLHLEDGGSVEGRGPLPALPLGRHLLDEAGQKTTLLSAPETLEMPAPGWGVTVPLAGLRGAAQGGFGDYDDLRAAGLALASHGADFLGINPVHAGFPCDPRAFSPYTPSHRRRLNILHIPTGAGGSTGPLIDHARDIPAKRAALRAAFEGHGNDAAFQAFLLEEGVALSRFALHQALSDLHGPYWVDWPAALQDPNGPAVASAARNLVHEIRFHAWLQFRAHSALSHTSEALSAAGMSHGLYLDLAVGTHPSGAETWDSRADFALGASLGAPPDAFSRDGQMWNLAPLNPHRLAATGFEALAQTLRAQLRYARMLRIDHILGFERAFWVPLDGTPGAYVQMPVAAMLAVVRIEAARAGAVIVGEDLGNIPEGLQDRLAQSGILGCRLIAFERDVAPGDYAPQTLASFATHDLPTWRGWRKGADIAARRRIGVIDPATARAAKTARHADVAAFDAGTPGKGAAPDRMHRFLAATNSRLVAVQIEDMLDVQAQPNLPGTTTEYPNWQQRLPKGPDHWQDDPRIARTAAIMKAAGR